MKKQLFSITLAALFLAVSAGSVQAKEIKKPVQMKKPAINQVVNRNTNYSNHHKYIAKANKKQNNKFAFNKSKSAKNKLSSSHKYKNHIAEKPKQKFNFGLKNKNVNKNNLTAQNQNVWKNNYQINKPTNFSQQNKPVFPKNI